MNGIKSAITNIKSDITSMKAQLDENTQIIKVFPDHLEVTEAKSTNLSPHSQEMKNDLVILTKIITALGTDLAFTLHKHIQMKNRFSFYVSKNYTIQLTKRQSSWRLLFKYIPLGSFLSNQQRNLCHRE